MMATILLRQQNSHINIAPLPESFSHTISIIGESFCLCNDWFGSTEKTVRIFVGGINNVRKNFLKLLGSETSGMRGR